MLKAWEEHSVGEHEPFHPTLGTGRDPGSGQPTSRMSTGPSRSRSRIIQAYYFASRRLER